MKEVLEHKPVYLDYMLGNESDMTLGDPCKCGKALRTCLCFQCTHLPPSCSDCFLQAHEANPWHWAHRWDESKGTLVQTDQSVLGRVVTFGHRRHQELECPERRAEESLAFTVVDLTGIHATRAFFCKCSHSQVFRTRHPRLEMLLACRMWPSTVKQASVGFTWEVMKDFHLHTLTSKKSAYDYMRAIQAKTNNAFPGDVKVRNRVVD